MRSGAWNVAGLAAALACSSGSDGPTPPPGGNNNTPGSISGRVVDADSGNAGVANVSVVLASGGTQQTVTTTSAGAFSLASAAVGAWTATLTVPGTHRMGTGETGTRSAAVAAGQNTALSDFVLRRPHGSVSGSVVEGATPVGGGTVAVTRGGFGTRNATPAANGTFTLSNLPVGAWSVQYTPPGSFQLATGETGMRAATVTENQTTNLAAFSVTSPPPQSGLVEIHLTIQTTFSQPNVIIVPGTTVRWINDSNTMHTITPENASQAGVWTRRETSTTGVVFEHTFNTPGQTYRYRCEPHSTDFTNGMVGVITVTN